jgi:hypothetical protein
MNWIRVKVGVAVAVAGVCLAGSAVAAGPTGASPPAYDYDPTTPGVQPPTSPLLAGYNYRSVRTYQVTIPVLVPLDQLQAIMAPQFSATPSSAGATTSTLNLAFFIDQRFDVGGTGTFGPVSGLLVSTVAVNKNTSPEQSELVFPAFEASGEIDALNESFGAGAARLAEVSVSIEQSDGQMRFAFKVHDTAGGLEVAAAASSPSGINTRSISDPVGLVFRTFDGRNANSAFRAASQSDTLPVPQAAARAKLASRGNRLRLPGGSLSVVGLGPTITFARNVEFLLKLSPGS